MRQAATRELFDYWNRLRRDRAAPERSDIDLAAIRGVLSDVFMLDIDAPHYFPFVSSGSRVNALFCGEQKGRSFLDLWPKHEAHNITAVLLTVIDAACPVVISAGAQPEGYREADLEVLLLPLRTQGQTQARILGLMSIAAHRSWLGLLPVEPFALRSLRAVDEKAVLSGTGGETLLTTWPVRMASQRKYSPKIHGHLRVFEGGK
jgi:hypothetical protein